MEASENSKSTAGRWWHSTTAKLAARTFVYANIALFFVGLLGTYAKRFDDSAIDEMLSDGIAITQENGEISLGFVCNGADSGFRYSIDRGSLELLPAARAAAAFRSKDMVSALFPVSREQVALAIGLVGGSVGMAPLLDRVRVAAVEAEVQHRPIGFVHEPMAVQERPRSKVLAPLAVAAAAAGGIVVGYFVGAAAGSKLGLDIDCSSKAVRKKLAMPATWRLALGSVFIRAYSSLQTCIDRRQLRTVAGHRVIDYLDAPKSERVGWLLSHQDDTLLLALREDPTRACGVSRSITLEGSDGKPTTVELSGRAQHYPSCWTDEDVAKALARRKAGLPRPLTNNPELRRAVLEREFAAARAQPEPTEADALRLALARLASGKMVSEAGAVSIDARDIRLLLDAKSTCE